jgi:hypothetical protein
VDGEYLGDRRTSDAHHGLHMARRSSLGPRCKGQVMAEKKVPTKPWRVVIKRRKKPHPLNHQKKLGPKEQNQ